MRSQLLFGRVRGFLHCVFLTERGKVYHLFQCNALRLTSRMYSSIYSMFILTESSLKLSSWLKYILKIKSFSFPLASKKSKISNHQCAIYSALALHSNYGVLSCNVEEVELVQVNLSLFYGSGCCCFHRNNLTY